ncbi:protein SSUH2 homolog [Elgaria multicarinata webbii]|uniref:protein SSUH2 homolog n=1 Tax=Elgaria multicarinata webbii TaxID=159646 RepID=UPI002FCD0517
MTQIPGPSAPPLYVISDYKDTTARDGEGKYFPSPPDMVSGHVGEPQPALMDWNAMAISKDIAKEAFLQYAANNCCYSKVPAREMEIREAQSFNTYRYFLETFTESRSCKWKTEPYKGDPVDSSPDGRAPYPWAVTVEVSDMFEKETRKIIVPRTMSVKECPNCRGRGKTTCVFCHGVGIDCSHCFGRGHVTCSKCGGKRKLLTFLQMKVKWENNIFEHVMDHGFGFPIKLFKTVNGQIMLLDDQPKVSPVVGFPERTINQVSRDAVEQHQAQFSSVTCIPGQVYPGHDFPGSATWNVAEKPEFPSISWMLRQRQTVELIYLTRVEYEWHGKFYSFYVYGNEHKVYAADYPKKCCCTIL